MTLPPAPEVRRNDSIRLMVLLLIVAAIFARVIGFHFVRWDDEDLLLQNPLLRPATFEHLKSMWTGPSAGLYTPLTYSLWWMIIHAYPPAGPDFFHGLNLLLHLFCTAAVFSIVHKCARSTSAAFVGALLFGLHPLQVETVAWISQTNTLLATALGLLSIRLYLEYADLIPRSAAIYLAASAAFLLALLAKPIAVVIPLVAAVLDFYFLRRPARDVARSLSPWLVAAVIFAIVAHHVQPAPAVRAPPLWERPAIAADALAFYVYKLFWPVRLTIDYGRTPALVLQGRRWIAAVGAVIVTLALWPRLGRLRPGLLVMVVCLLPVLGFVPFEFQRYSTVADRYMYFPMLGTALIAAILPRPIVLLAVLLLAIQTELRLGVWQNTSTLAHSALTLDPMNVAGNKILGAELERQQRWADAADAYRKALVRDPDDGDIHFNLANVLRNQSDYQEAIDQYLVAIRLLNPDLRLRAMNNLGIAYFQSGDPDMAEAEFLQILQIDPHNADARQNLANVAIGVPSQ
jgi:protein O-mannosyl-transferase